jgi:phospho-N-acetylmuramoyl-pentapeptide-transferase
MNLVIYLVVSFVFTAILGKIFIPILKKMKVGQNERNDGPSFHFRKKGTPTMGGIMIMITVIISMFIFGFLNKDVMDIKPYIACALAAVGFGIIGFIDDYKKIVLKNTKGLSPTLKMIGLFVIAGGFTYYLLHYLNIGTDIIIPFTDISFTLPVWIYILFTIFVMLATTNAVNLTDGVDGLAGSVTTIIFLAMAFISYKLNGEALSYLSVVFAGATFGFLIYNFYKAKVMMGDTGSLLLGGAISTIMITLKNPFLIVILAIIPVIEALSDILQLIYTYKNKGKRLLKMAPLHHHLELSGWRENKVVAVFSLVTLVGAALSILSVMI